MPALPPVPGVIRTDLTFVVSMDNHARCRWFTHFAGSSPTAGNMTDLAHETALGFIAHLRGLMHSSASLALTTCTNLTSDTSPVGIESAVVPGTRTGEELPASTCVIDSHHVARRYRGGHSRTYWPFGVRDDLANGQQWTSAFIGDVDTELELFRTDHENGFWAGAGATIPCNVSYYEGSTVFVGPSGRARNIATLRETPIVDFQIGHTVRQFVGTQRKRMLAGS